MTDAERLADAKEKLHELLTGKAVRVLVDQNGERVEYTAANRAQLQAYVNRLEARLNQTSCGPLQAYF